MTRVPSGVIQHSYLIGDGVCSLEGEKRRGGYVLVFGPHSVDARSTRSCS